MILGFGLGTGACSFGDGDIPTVWEPSSLSPGPIFCTGPGKVAFGVSFLEVLATASLASGDVRLKGSCSQIEILLRFFLRLAVDPCSTDGDGGGGGVSGGLSDLRFRSLFGERFGGVEKNSEVRPSQLDLLRSLAWLGSPSAVVGLIGRYGDPIASILAVVVGAMSGVYKAADVDVAGTAGDTVVESTKTVNMRRFMIRC